MDILTLQNVDFFYGGLRAVSCFSMQVEDGSITSLIGPNGAGKTTVFNLISGSLRPGKGSICFQNKPIHGQPAHKIAALGIARTFQNIKLFENLSVREHIDLSQFLSNKASIFGEIFGTPAAHHDRIKRKEKTDSILQFLGLEYTADFPAVDLPYGLQRRLEFGRALAMDARIILLDEPTAGMNIGETSDMINLIQKVRAKGVTILLVEHDMRVVMNISDHIWVINYGSVIASGTPDEVRHNPEVIAAYLGESGSL